MTPIKKATVVILCALSALCSFSVAADKPLNVVVLYADDWRHDTLGLRAKGYFTGHVGKWHDGKFPAANYDFGRSYAGMHWMKQPDGTPIHVTQRNENDALEFLRTRPADKPFCLIVAFFAPHAEDGNKEQFLPQPQSMELYRGSPEASARLTLSISNTQPHYETHPYSHRARCAPLQSRRRSRQEAAQSLHPRWAVEHGGAREN